MEGVLHYDKSMVGNILAASAIAYGIAKFIMGSLSDRSDPRKFMACGLLLTALCNVAFGGVANYWVHLGLWTLNGADSRDGLAAVRAEHRPLVQRPRTGNRLLDLEHGHQRRRWTGRDDRRPIRRRVGAGSPPSTFRR